MEELIRWLQGYLIIQIEGECFENLLRICRAHHVFLWKIIQTEKCFQVCLYKRDFLCFAGLCKKVCLRLHVKKKRGLPFLLQKLCQKLYFVILLLAAIGLLKVTQLHIWAVEIQGNEMLTEDEIMDFMEQEKIQYGMYKKNINCENLEMQMRDTFPLITWVSVYINGTKLHIDLKENALGIEKEEQVPSDILASKTGKITSILVAQGNPCVKAGDEVVIGDVLVSCNIPVYDENETVISYQQTIPEATIRMQTIENYEDSLSRTYLMTQFSSHKDCYYYIEFGKKRYYLNKLWQKKGNYETLCCTKQLSVLEHLYLPFFYGNELTRKVDFQYFAYTDEEMEKVLSDRFQKYILCLQEKGVQIMKKNVKISKNGSTMYMSGELEVIEDITW